jgi:hypothetical protein
MSRIFYHKKLLFSIKSAFIRVLPRPTIIAKSIFLLALALPAAENKVVIQTEAPAADVYLDGNFVAKTDILGNLPMENLPPGTFRFTVKKNGYQPFDGSFQMIEGESKIVQVQLSRIPARQSSEILPPVKKPYAEAKTPPPESLTTWKPPEKTPPPAVPIAAAPVETKAAEDPWSSTTLMVTAATAALLWIGIVIVKRRTRRIPMESPQLEQVPPDDDLPDIPASRIKPPPEFVNQLKRREELMEAGFLPINSAKREKEVVIVLPKEAYTSKEE